MESLLSVGCWQRGGGRVQRADTCPADNQVYAFTERGRGLHAETAPSALRVILKLVIGGQSSAILIDLGAINLQFHGWFVPISLRPVLGIVAVYITNAVWSSCS